MRLSSTSTIAVALCCLTTPPSVQGWTTPSHPTNGINNGHQITRQSVLETILKGGVVTVGAVLLPSLTNTVPSAFAADSTVTTLPTGVTYEVIKAGKGPKPEMGELAAIRFAAFYGDRKIDDIFDTPEPYYTVSIE